jgi:hypothetical protein
MHLATFRHPSHFFGTPLRLGEDEAPPEPAPEPAPEPEPEPEPLPPPPPPPPPEPVCKPVGKPFFEDRICYQVYECRSNGDVTYEKRHATCPHPAPWHVYYPYPYVFPVTTSYQPTTEVVVKAADKEPSVAPYAIGAVVAAALLYAVLK